MASPSAPSAPVAHPPPPVSTADTALSGANTDGGVSQSSERLAHDGDSHSSGGPPSPVLSRAARSQISTAVSFEGARAAGSAALPSRSLDEESALSAAEGDESLSREEHVRTTAGPLRALRGDQHRPSNSLISTAVQPGGQWQHRPASPKQRGNSFVSHTPQHSLGDGIRRAGTPGSTYAQDGTAALRLRAGSPPLSQMGEQLSASGELQEDSDGWRHRNRLLHGSLPPGPAAREHQGEASFMHGPPAAHTAPLGFLPAPQQAAGFLLAPAGSLTHPQLDQHGDSINCAANFPPRSNLPPQGRHQQQQQQQRTEPMPPLSHSRPLWGLHEHAASGGIGQHPHGFRPADAPGAADSRVADAGHRHVATSRNMDADQAGSHPPFLPIGVHAMFNPAMQHVDASNAMQLAQALQQQLQALNALALPALSFAEPNHFPFRPHPGVQQPPAPSHGLPPHPQLSVGLDLDPRAALSHHSQPPYTAPSREAGQQQQQQQPPPNPLPNLAALAGPSLPPRPGDSEMERYSGVLNPQFSYSHHVLQQTALSLIAQATSMATQGNNPAHHPAHRLQGDFPLASVPMQYSQAQSKPSKAQGRSDRSQERYAAPQTDQHAAARGGGRSGSTLAVAPPARGVHSAAASQDEGGAGGSECIGPPAAPPAARQAERPACSTQSPARDAAVHQAASVHATVEADEALSEGETEDLSSMHRDAAQHSKPFNAAAGVDVASQLCRGSHSASPVPSLTAPAVAIAMGPMTASTMTTSGPSREGERQQAGNSSIALGLMVGPSTRSVETSGGATNSGTVNMNGPRSSMGADEGAEEGAQQNGAGSEKRGGEGMHTLPRQESRVMSVQEGDAAGAGAGSQGYDNPAVAIQGLQVSEGARVGTSGDQGEGDHARGEDGVGGARACFSGTHNVATHSRMQAAAGGRAGAQASSAAAAANGATEQRGAAAGRGGALAMLDEGQEGRRVSGTGGPLLAANSAAMPAAPRPAVAEVTDMGDAEPDGIGSPVWPATCSASNGDHPLPDLRPRGGRLPAVRPTGSVNFAGPSLHPATPMSGDEADGRKADTVEEEEEGGEGQGGDVGARAVGSQMHASSRGTSPPDRQQMPHRPQPAHAAPLRRHAAASYGSNPEVLPQETEIHGMFPNHAATAAAAQQQRDLLTAAAAASEVLPQDTEVHGMYGQLAATAAAAQMAAAATHVTPQRGLPPLPHHHASWSQARGSSHRAALGRTGAASAPQHDAAGPSRGKANEHVPRAHRQSHPTLLPLSSLPIDPLATPHVTPSRPSPLTPHAQLLPEAASAIRHHSTNGYASSAPSPPPNHLANISPNEPSQGTHHMANGPANAEVTAAADSDGPSHGQPPRRSGSGSGSGGRPPDRGTAGVSEHGRCNGVCDAARSGSHAQRDQEGAEQQNHSHCNGSVSNDPAHEQQSPSSRRKSSGEDHRSGQSHQQQQQQQQPAQASNCAGPSQPHHHHYQRVSSNFFHEGEQQPRAAVATAAAAAAADSSGRSQASNRRRAQDEERRGAALPLDNLWEGEHRPERGAAAAAAMGARRGPQPQMTEVGQFHLDPSAATISDCAGGGDFGQVDAAVNQHPPSPAGEENGEELEGPPHAEEAQRSTGGAQAGPSGQWQASKSVVTPPARPAAGTSSSNGRRSRRDSKRQRLSYEGGYKEPAADCSMSTS